LFAAVMNHTSDIGFVIRKMKIKAIEVKKSMAGLFLTYVNFEFTEN